MQGKKKGANSSITDSILRAGASCSDVVALKEIRIKIATMYQLYESQDYIVLGHLLILHCSVSSLLISAFACIERLCMQLHCSHMTRAKHLDVTQNFCLGAEGPHRLSDNKSTVGKIAL
jgi:hypothetical protein